MDQYAVQTKQLTKKYNNFAVVDQVSLNVKSGHIYGILGRNGAGKTTIMKMMMHLTAITSGEITLFGKNIASNGKSLAS